MTSVKKVKVALLALVAALVIAIPTSAFAADGSITIQNQNLDGKTGVADNHTYEVYQIFSGDLGEDGKTLSNIGWGTGVDLDKVVDNKTLIQALNAEDVFASCENANDVADVLKANQTFDNDTAKLFSQIVNQYLSDVKKTVGIGESLTIPEDESGYYLIQDADTNGKNTAATRAILGVFGTNENIKVKADTPTVDKFVKEDTAPQHGVTKEGDAENWGKIGDYEIGQVFTYQLVGTLPSNYDDYETYWYKFNDTLSAGQTFQGDVHVYIVNNDTREEITTGFNATPNAAQAVPATKEAAAETTFTVEFEDLKTNSKINKDTVIEVEYKAMLNKWAVKGNEGNVNKVDLEFSNNPNKGHDGEKGKTPEKFTVVFTYDLKDTKVKDDGETPITSADAKFILLNSDKTQVFAGLDNDGYVVWTKLSEVTEEALKAEPYAVTATANGTFGFEGLDAETYYLREVVAPDGFNLPSVDFEVTISRTFNEDYNGAATANGELKTLNVTQGTGNATEGAVYQKIINTEGSKLPSTGGIGTTIFTIVGIALIVAAAAIMVVRRRNAAALQ